MNCFQIVSSFLPITTPTFDVSTTELLWIAFRLYLRSYQSQLDSASDSAVDVVNCFQIVSSFLPITTASSLLRKTESLWIAFRLYLRSYQSQQRPRMMATIIVVNCFQIVSSFLPITTTLVPPDNIGSCELLSDCIFVLTNHNVAEIMKRRGNVVNCFQIVSSFLPITTVPVCVYRVQSLWIAFRLYLRSYQSQRFFINLF